MVQRVLDSGLFNTLGSFSWSRSRASTELAATATRSGESSTTGLAQKNGETTVAITRTVEVENSYELQDNYKRTPEWQRV